MTNRYYRYFFGIIWIIFSSNFIFSQEINDESSEIDTEYISKKFNQLIFYDYRGSNALDAGLGTALLTGDVDEAKVGFYGRIGYKRYLIDHLALGLNFNKYNLYYNDIKQDLISVDFNLEFLALPYNRFSPFLSAGFGYNASDDFEANAVKVQGGIGIEYIVVDGLGIKLFGEYNYSLDDEMDFLILDEEDDTFLRVGLGVNIYFGGQQERERRLESIPTQIKSNPIIPNN